MPFEELLLHVHSDPPFIQEDIPIPLRGLHTIEYILVLEIIVLSSFLLGFRSCLLKIQQKLQPP